MSIGLLIERRNDQSCQPISMEEWTKLIAKHGDLRIRVAPYSERNPRTGEALRIQVGQADAEVCVEGQWVPFLRWRRGKLVTEYRSEFDNERDAVRKKIVVVSKELGANVYNDIEDSPLGW